MAAATAVVAAAAITAVGITAAVIAVAVTATISADGIMAAAIFTAGRRISVRSPAIVRFPRNA